jgi:hypothetical protein
LIHETKKGNKKEQAMTGKPPSNIRQARRSEADLGQKEAGLEKASEEELRHMEGGDALVSPGSKKRNLDQNSSCTLPEIAEAESEISHHRHAPIISAADETAEGGCNGLSTSTPFL